MKAFFKILLFSTCLLFMIPAEAQNLRNNPRLQERLTQVKLTEIQKHLELSEEKMKLFAPIYKRYDAEINTLHFSRPTPPTGTRPRDLSPEEADKFITAQLDHAIKMSTVRRKYYSEFKTVLTPQQVMDLYRSEAQMRRRVMMEVRKRQSNQP